ncbi:MAG: hypothetical protein MJB14_20770, partial [Spirochaetes bacterium]|nr:hypothetical protein [Spirochaetota bacterium]
ITCKNIDDSKKPLQIGDQFNQTDSIYCYLNFKPTQSTKTGYCKWIKPSGQIKHISKIDIPGTWSFYYTYLRPGNSGLEKGIWTVEIYIYGKLEERKHIVVK